MQCPEWSDYVCVESAQRSCHPSAAARRESLTYIPVLALCLFARPHRFAQDSAAQDSALGCVKVDCEVAAERTDMTLAAHMGHWLLA